MRGREFIAGLGGAAAWPLPFATVISARLEWKGSVSPGSGSHSPIIRPMARSANVPGPCEGGNANEFHD
jgi:hypothetical protein